MNMKQEVLTLVLDNMYELDYAINLCEEIGVSFKVQKQMVDKDKTNNYTEEDIKYEVAFSGTEVNVKFMLHLLTWRMEHVKLYKECLTKEVEVETDKSKRRTPTG
jgi:hypothetical protein